MSLALIEESAKEVRRLAIAGSPLAVGDFRLKKIIPALEQAGAKVPVFGQVAKAIGELVNGTDGDSAMRLLNLSTLINAILFTQGQSGADGEVCELEMFATSCCSTKTTARVLKPLVEALTSSGGGRFELIKTAWERGAFNDLRLIDPAIQALGDTYSELADLVAEKVLPGYGPGIVPRLKAALDIKGKKHDARKLAVMHRLDPEGTLELCKTALEEGSAEVKAAAIGCLGKHEDCLQLVLEQANAKNKLLRAAALDALAEHDRPETTNLFIDLLKDKSLEILILPFRALRNKQVLNSLLGEGQRVFDLLIKGDAEQIPRFWQILDCLSTRKEAEVAGFLMGCFDECDKLAKVKASQKSIFGGTDLMARLTVLLYQIGSPNAFAAVLEKRNVLPPPAFPQVLRSALCTWPASQVFVEFSPLLEQKKGAGKEKSEELQRCILSAHRLWFNGTALLDSTPDESPALQMIVWDERWLDAAIKADLPNIVCCLARPNHKATLNYLLKLRESINTCEGGSIVRGLVRCQYPKVSDYFLDLVAKKTKAAKYFDYELQLLFQSARYLPVSDLPRFDAFAAKLDETFVDRFLEAISPLRSTAQPN